MDRSAELCVRWADTVGAVIDIASSSMDSSSSSRDGSLCAFVSEWNISLNGSGSGTSLEPVANQCCRAARWMVAAAL